jgi:hypothetical protein
MEQRERARILDRSAAALDEGAQGRAPCFVREVEGRRVALRLKANIR